MTDKGAEKWGACARHWVRTAFFFLSLFNAISNCFLINTGRNKNKMRVGIWYITHYTPNIVCYIKPTPTQRGHTQYLNEIKALL